DAVFRYTCFASLFFRGIALLHDKASASALLCFVVCGLKIHDVAEKASGRAVSARFFSWVADK
ncbi:MAG: hypothetical protein K5919_09000, partial [Clostridiales bacterium]|nr:hypothetical protein [Clostridiales bacterium]